jgi:hypothetical protein
MRSVVRGVLVALCLAGLSAPAAQAADGMEIAFSDEDGIVGQSYGPRDELLKIASQLGATRMRILVQWSRVSDAGSRTPLEGHDYAWGPVDEAIDAAAKLGIRTQLALTGPAPAYAAGNHRVSFPVVRPNAAAYAEFVREAATHFLGRVDRYSIWNEPNYSAWISPRQQAPEIYRKLFVAGYAAIKAVDPAAQVLIGETVPYSIPNRAMSPLTFLRRVACVNRRYRRAGHCTPLVADGYAHHPYEFTHPPSFRYPGADNAPIGTLSRLRTALNRLASSHALTAANGRSLDIYLTESGYFVTGKRAVAVGRRSRWLPQQFDIALKQARVREMLQYNIVVPTNTPFSTGLLSQSTGALPDFANLLKWTQRAVAQGRVARPAGPLTLAFRRPSGVGAGDGGIVLRPPGPGGAGGSGGGQIVLPSGSVPGAPTTTTDPTGTTTTVPLPTDGTTTPVPPLPTDGTTPTVPLPGGGTTTVPIPGGGTTTTPTVPGGTPCLLPAPLTCPSLP